jgi:purine nucleoside phosphorylase
MPTKPQAKIAVIGGTGLEDIEGMTEVKQVSLDTPFGKPSDAITIGKLDNIGIAFLPRHGRGHFISPTELPSRANIYALKSLGVDICSSQTNSSTAPATASAPSSRMALSLTLASPSLSAGN